MNETLTQSFTPAQTHPAYAVSIIIPTIPPRIDWLRTAVDSVRSQIEFAEADCQIIAVIDPGSPKPQIAGIDCFTEGADQCSKVNAGAKLAKGSYLAILHDDDLWHPAFLKTALDSLDKVEFVSSNQLELDEQGGVIQINDFPCPSGWVMYRGVFDAVGPFDPSFPHHCDAHWLARLGVTPYVKARAHLVESTAPQMMNIIDGEWRFNRFQNRPELATLLKQAEPKPRLIHTQYPVPLVTRRQHTNALKQRIEATVQFQIESNHEYMRMVDQFGKVPW